MNVAPTWFVDTSFWIALLEAGDADHSRALAWQKRAVADHVALFTTEAVLWVTLSYFAAPATRGRALALYQGAHGRRDISVMEWDSVFCDAAVQPYASRNDKAWSIVDCLSFEVMSHCKVTEALTADHHFEQAGFKALLLRDPPTP